MKSDYPYYLTDNEQEESEFTSEREYLDISTIINDIVVGTAKNWLIILVVMSISASIGFLYEKTHYVPVYQVSATFIVDVSNAISYDDTSLYQKTMEQISLTFPKIIANNALRNMVKKDLGLSRMPSTTFIYAEAMSDTSLITIYVTATNAQFAYEVLQSVLRNYPIVTRSVLGNTEMDMITESGVPKEPENYDSGRRTAVASAVASMAICYVIILGFSFLKKTVRKEEDFQTIFNINCLANIPMVKFKKRTNSDNNLMLISKRGVGHRFTEAIRILRTRIERDHDETGAQSYMISSTLPGEGKSTIAANLAISLAAAEKKVIIVDLDIRNASILKTLGKEPIDKGYEDVLHGRIKLEDAIVYDKENNVFVLSIGNNSEVNASMLNDPEIGSILTKLKTMADYILIDTAPSGILSDASNVVGYVDAGIYIVCQDYAPIERIKDGIDMLTEGGLRICGCLLNMSEDNIVGQTY